MPISEKSDPPPYFRRGRLTAGSDLSVEANGTPRIPVLESVGTSGRRFPAIGWLVIVGIAIAIAKPWAAEPPAAPIPAAPIPALPMAWPSARGAAITDSPVAAKPASSSPTLSPAPRPSLLPDSAPCYADAWRLVVVEQGVDYRRRIWFAIEPVGTASGPRDPAIPFRKMVSADVVTIGFCAPYDRAHFSDARIWQLRRQVEVEFVDMPRLESPRRGVAELYRPPAGAARNWQPADYVFQVPDAAGVDVWFGLHLTVHRRP